MKTTTWVILGIAAIGTYFLYKKYEKGDSDKEEVKAGFVSASDKLGVKNKIGTLSKNGL